MTGGALEIKEAQRLAWLNKLTQGFNTDNVPLEFMLLHGEVAESFQAWRRAQDDLGEELADVALFLFGLAEMTGVDLDSEIQRKITKNVGRQYARDSNGVPRQCSGTAAAADTNPETNTPGVTT